MRFMMRSLFGLAILGVTLSLLGFAGGRIAGTLADRDAREQGRRPPQERVFSVNVDTLQLQDITPVITAYGDVASWRELEIRTVASGVLVELSDAFRDGGVVAEGDVLFRIDTADARADVALAQTQIKEAEAELIEARAALALAQGDLGAAVQQKALREQALARQNSLKERGVGSESAVETAEIALSGAVQTELARQQSVAQAQARILRAEIGLDRQNIALEDAQRALKDTVVLAPFDGVISEVNAVVGRLVSSNEVLGRMVDPAALEIAFRVSNAQFARITDARGNVLPVEAKASLDLGGVPLSVRAQVDRAGAAVGIGQAGRLVYARINPEDGKALRPGDFLQVKITENPLSDVAVVPAASINSSGEMLLIGEDERLEATNVEILRRQEDEMIITGAPAGQNYVLVRTPQLGAGVKVKPVLPDAKIEEKEMIALDDDRRDALVAAIEGNQWIPADRKTRILEQLNAEQVPADLIARLEARMGGGPRPSGGEGQGSGEAIALDDSRRAALVAFVEANDRMPAGAKTRVLEQLQEAEVPADLVSRLEERMGGDASAAQSDTVSDPPLIALDDARRAKLVAFVEGNGRMPASAKERILAQLAEPQVPADIVERLESRMGG